MAEFGQFVTTDKGSELIMKTIKSNEAIHFTRFAASARKYADAELGKLVLLEDIRQQNNVSEINVESSSTILIRVILSNMDLTDGYYIKTVGLYADDPDNGEILYGVAVEQSENGCYVPPYKNQTASNLYFNLSVAVGNSQNVRLEVDPGAVVTIRQLNAVQQKIIDIVYQQSTGYTDQKIADLIGGASSTLDTLSEIEKAMKDHEDVAKALEAAIGSKASEAEFDSHKKEIEKLLGNTDISAIGDGTVTGAISGLNTGMLQEKLSVSINTNIGNVVSINCQQQINGIMYIDAMIQVVNAAYDQEDFLSVTSSKGKPITYPNRIDSILLGASDNYFITCPKNTSTFKVNGKAIPPGTYKLIMTLDA